MNLKHHHAPLQGNLINPITYTPLQQVLQTPTSFGQEAEKLREGDIEASDFFFAVFTNSSVFLWYIFKFLVVSYISDELVSPDLLTVESLPPLTSYLNFFISLVNIPSDKISFLATFNP